MHKLLLRVFAATSAVLISILTLAPIAQAGTLAFVHDPEVVNHQSKLLQFTSEGHVLGFKNGGVVIASARHLLKVDFLGSKGVAPTSGEKNSTDVAQPLHRVKYQNIW